MIKNKKFLKIDEFYKAAIDCAMDVDPRGRKIVEKELKDIKKDYDSITDKKKKNIFDTDNLFNPYADTRILNIAEDKEIKKEHIKIWIAILIQALLILSLIFKVDELIDSINILSRGVINFQEQFSVFITHFDNCFKLFILFNQ